MSLDSLADVPGSRRKTPLRTVQIDDDLWQRLGDAAETAGIARADAIRESADWLATDPGLWRDFRRIADLRGETVRRAVLGELRRYVSRHRNLLGAESPRATDAAGAQIDPQSPR